jgi:NAD(P)-dependent dehydrogenase (short-subunit alcohol dehydrogenase family)
MLTRALALELSAHAITVNTVAPGWRFRWGSSH